MTFLALALQYSFACMRTMCCHLGRKSSWLRYAASAWSIVWIVCHLAALDHQRTQRHAYCAEHGEAVHVASPDAASASRAPLRGDALSKGSAHVDDHEHCAVGMVRREPGLHADALPSQRPLARLLPLLQAFETPLADSARWRLAPKTSPPV